MQQEVLAAGTVSLKFRLARRNYFRIPRFMSDFGNIDSFLEMTWDLAPGKRKGKKENKKDKKSLKTKNLTMNTEHFEKDKTMKISKEAMKKRKRKKKEKKKKKRAAVEQGSFYLTQGCKAETKPLKPKALDLPSSDTPDPDQLPHNSKKKTKRIKEVMFHLSPTYIRVKRPKFVSSSQQSLKESLILENESVRGHESCSQVTVTGHNQEQTHGNDSQCTSDDINSQDLFITQRTFRAPPSQTSTDEAAEKAVTQMEQHHKEPVKCPEDPQVLQHYREMLEHEQSPKMKQELLQEKEKVDFLNKGILSLQPQMQSNTNTTQRKKRLSLSYMAPRVNPYLDEPVLSPSPKVTVSNKHSSSSEKLPCPSLRPSVLPKMSMTSTSTQTENFFTTELSSYLNFYKKTREMVHLGDIEPLDLSLAQRAREDQRTCLSVKGDSHKTCYLSYSPDMKDIEAQEKSCQHPCSVKTRGKKESALSPRARSNNKCADTSTSSEDSEQHSRNGRIDMVQVRAVQTKLNESFFFKAKGEGQSPRPQSPLMKLAQSSCKVKKGH